MRVSPYLLMDKLSAQTVFDGVVVLAAGMTSRCESKSGFCAYRSPGGRSACFVGGLMTSDEVYRGNATPVDGPVDSLQQRGELPARLHPHVAMLLDLQEVHDNKGNWRRPGGIADGLRKVALLRNLSTQVLDQHFPVAA
ncbi:hypothetical protein [Methylobacterium ajmalii]|uniref:hypothetical protein n=1 Tax=Methylobacterium ajmalii TaxID=2738439 RepID=UPI002F35860B